MRKGETMSEGKFNKRIRLFLATNTPSGYLEGEGLHHVTDLDMMLDEACKEYLSFTDNLGPPPLKGDKIDFEKWEPVIQEVNCKREKWFLTWFGNK